MLDMGIISPLMFLTYFLIRQRSLIGYVLLRMSFMVCIGVGIILLGQSVFQLLSGYLISIPALVTKVIIFVMLAGFASVFDYRLKKVQRTKIYERTRKWASEQRDCYARGLKCQTPARIEEIWGFEWKES